MKAKLEQQIPPLQDIHFNSRPQSKRALAWSCDGELAVAADDSVHILVPEFPDPRAAAAAAAAADDDEGCDPGAPSPADGPYRQPEPPDDDHDDADHADLRPPYLRHRVASRQRPQFSGGALRLPASHPRLNPRLNRSLFEDAGAPFPGEAPAPAADHDHDHDNDNAAADESDASASAASADEAHAPGPAGTADAAGRGIISGAMATLNHVVAVSWSPAGLGRAHRPVLAVLTAAGVVGVYGDGPARKGGGVLRGEGGLLRRRSLEAWEVLWGVGGRLAVPGGQEPGEYVRGFAWSREVAPGAVLLAYVTDSQEVVVLSVQSRSVAAEQRGKGQGTAGEGDGGRTVWQVQEVARFAGKGPHPEMSVWDPDYVPQGTSFGLSWGPWVAAGDSKVCVLSYIRRSYVGFRRIVVNGKTSGGRSLDVAVDQTDLDGRCAFLSTDSFVEFEDAIWTRGQACFVRGLVVTGFRVEPFEVTVAGAPSQLQQTEHDPGQCGTAYDYPRSDQLSTNPIQDLFIHPPATDVPTKSPTYTLIRLSATSSNHDWLQTNAASPESPGVLAPPRWAGDIAQKLEISVPADLHTRGLLGGNESDQDEDADAESETYSDEGAIPQGPEVHPYRLRLHGVAASPGGGSSAVLVSVFGTQQPERGRWTDMRSTLIFDWRARGVRDQPWPAGPGRRQLTTEGRMWEWMYGGGPEVAGITSEVVVDKAGRMRDMFADVAARQACELCGERLEPRGRHSVCSAGHLFSTCGTSGLAIQAPGISRTCGACGARTLNMGVLVAKAPGLEGPIRDELEGATCGSCGGKFVD